MTQQIINIGSAPNDGTGDTIRSSFNKTNLNFTEVYGAVLTSGAQNLVFATPNGSSGLPSLRALVSSDIPSIPISTGISGLGTGIASSLASGSFKKILGNIVNVTMDSSSGSLYTVTAPTTTFTFTSGGLTTSGGSNDYTNYVYYTNYQTNTNYWSETITFTPTADGNGLGAGLHSANGDISSMFIMTGANKGKISIEAQRTGTITTRATSTTALTYTNSVSTIKITFERKASTYTATAYVIDGSGNVSGTPVSVSYTDTYTSGGVQNVWSVPFAGIFHKGGSQTILTHTHDCNEFVQNEIMFYGASISAGANCGADGFKFTSIIKGIVPDGVSVEAGGGNQTSNFAALQPEILLLKPKIIFYGESALNDIINGVSAGTTQANIVSFINFCLNNKIVPILTELTPISSSYTPPSVSNAVAQAAITALNAYMNALGYVTVVPLNADFTSAGSLNPIYDTDGIHINAAGHRLYAADLIPTLNTYMTTYPTTRAYGESITVDQNLASYRSIINQNNGTSSIVGFNQLSSTATGYFQTYSATNSSTGFPNKTLFGNNTAGIIMSAFGASGTFQVLTGGNVIATNTRMNISSTGKTFFGGNTTGTALVHIAAETATASTAPIKFTAPAALLATPEALTLGVAINGDYLNFTTTTGTVRRVLVASNSGRSTAQTAANNSVATYTLGATDASYEVSANVLVTTSSAENFTVTVSYTDEGNTARVLTLNFQTLGATIGIAINFANGAVPYEGLVTHIRCKASTSITIKTTGTFTGATYNVEGIIKQTA